MAANPTIQLKRKITSGAPSTLSIGEPAVNTADNQLYVGVNSSGVKWIGAEIENSATNGTTWSSDLKLATKKAIGDYFAPLSGATFTGDITLSGGSDIRFVETGGGTDYVAIQAPSSVSTGNVTLTLPGSYAAADGYVLSSTTGGTLSWISAGAATSLSVTETSANSSFNLLFTDATSTTSVSVFIDTDDKITYNPSTDLLTVGGDLAVNGGDITTTLTGTSSIFDTNTLVVNFAGAAQTLNVGYDSTGSSTTNIVTADLATAGTTKVINIGTGATDGTTTVTIGSSGAANSTVAVGGALTVSGNTTLTGDLAVNGADITTTATGTATLFNTNATTVNVGGAATNMTLGSTSGTITLRGGTLVGNTTTQNAFNTTATTLNLGGVATAITMGDATTATTTIRGGTLVGNTTTQNAFNTTATTLNLGGVATAITMGDATTATTTIRGGTLVGNTTTQNLFNTTATTLNVGGAATTLSIGAATGTATINNANTVVTGDLAVNGSDITTTSTGTATLFNTNATTVNMAGAGTTVSIGAATGTTTINNTNTVVTGDLAVNGADITTTSTGTATLFNTNATTLNVGGAATTLSIGAATGTATINNANTVVTGDLAVNGGDITSTTTGTFNFLVSNPTIYVGTSSATDIRVGKTDNTGTTRLYGDVNIVKGSLTTAASTASIFDTTATTITIGAASTSTTIGSSVSGTTILNSPTVRGAATSQALYDTVATTMNFAGVATTLNIGNDGAGATSTTNIVVSELSSIQSKTINLGTGASDGTTAINIGTSSTAGTSTVTVGGILAISASTAANITTSNTSANVFTSSVTSLNIGSAATTVSIGAATGTTTINNANTVVTGDLAVNGADITTTSTGTATLFNTNATTLNIGGAATTMTIGSSTATINLGSGTTGATVVIKGNLQVDGATTTINSTTLTVDDKLIELAHSPSGAVGNDAAVDGGGIQLNSSQGNKTLTWVDSTDAWTSSEHINLASGKAYYINGTSVLNSTTLGSTITGSSLTQVGTVSLGTWNGTAIAAAYGGTGQTTYTQGDLLYASAATTLSKLSASSTAGAVVSSTGSGSNPEYKVISVTNGSVTAGSGTLTLAVQDASADGSTKGLATFNSTHFDSASGVITLDTIDGGTYA